ncbi:MAG: stage II sporulation protein R [Oscillospiraceae bacterium]|nr:stage II sporulation protein R [Oscillospiraceae bacterium]
MKLKVWELSLLVALVLAVLWGALLEQRQQDLSDRLIRLHVLANSDEVGDQALKLHVRDQVLEVAAPLLEGETDRAEAEAILAAHLPRITETAQTAVANWGRDDPVRVALTLERHPTRAYESFTLPAGRYSALRVEIGTARGQNWWCVVFPPLCLGAAEGGAGAIEADALTGEEIALITGGESGYQIRFRALELIDGLRGIVGG